MTAVNFSLRACLVDFFWMSSAVLFFIIFRMRIILDINLSPLACFYTSCFFKKKKLLRWSCLLRLSSSLHFNLLLALSSSSSSYTSPCLFSSTSSYTSFPLFSSSSSLFLLFLLFISLFLFIVSSHSPPFLSNFSCFIIWNYSPQVSFHLHLSRYGYFAGL